MSCAKFIREFHSNFTTSVTKKRKRKRRKGSIFQCLIGNSQKLDKIFGRSDECDSQLNKKKIVSSQKVPTPTIESLPSAPMESESVKRSSSVKIAKPTQVAMVEGTSVTPRQRPKGQGVGTGPISLSGQIVSQISGQGNTPGNSFVPVNPSATVAQPYIVQNIQSVSTIPVNPQPPLQLSMQSTFAPAQPAHIPSPNQPANFPPPQTGASPFGQSQSPLISQSPLTQQSPVTVQEKGAYYFESRQHEPRPTPAVPGNDENLEALFPPSGKLDQKSINFTEL